MIRFIDALNKRRAVLKDGDKGFTLIELLVVVIIIGILAAIAIPIYLNVQNNAKDSAVKSDLTNVKTAVVSYYTQKQGYPADLATTTLKDYGFSGYSVTYGTGSVAPKYTSKPADTATTFCVTATSPTGSVFYVTDSGGVVGPVPATPATGDPTKPGGC